MPSKKIEILKVSFVRGTYSVQMREAEKIYWPLLDFHSSGKLTDALCCCENPKCAHIEAALEAIRRGPFLLHELFYRHFWHQLFYELSGLFLPNSSTDFEEQPNGWMLRFGTTSLRLQARQEKEVASLRQLLADQPSYNERNSIKFSQLTKQEAKEWAKGRPGPWLQYQLSFWSELALLLFLWEPKNSYCSLDLSFVAEKSLSSENLLFALETTLFRLEIDIAAERMLPLWPYLHTLDPKFVRSMHWQDNLVGVQKIDKDFCLLSYSEGSEEAVEELAKTKATWSLDSWCYCDSAGLWRSCQESWPKKILSKELALSFEKFSKRTLLLGGVEVDGEPLSPSYSAGFEADGTLRLSPYLWEPEDLAEILVLNESWVYQKRRGFQKIAEGSLLDQGQSMRIEKKKVGAYIERHLEKLIQWAPFEVHTTALPRQIGYSVEPEKAVLFFDLLESQEGFHSFGQWCYTPLQGLFHYKREPLAIEKGKHLWSELERWVVQNREALAQVVGFWAKESPLEKEYVTLQWREESPRGVGLELTPCRILKNREKALYWAGALSYCQDVGFYHHREKEILPKELSSPLWVPREGFDEFWQAQRAALQNDLLSCENAMFLPVTEYKLDLHTVLQASSESILFQADIQTESGRTDLLRLFSHFKKTEDRFYPTQAGLIDFDSRLFGWKEDLSITEEGLLSMRSLDFLRLANRISVETASRELHAFLHAQNEVTAPLPDISWLQSNLRKYQTIGVRWMWQLMRHGLGALLCDDMGLGKTHQVMALIAALKKSNPKEAILVVCPTSVLFHWYEKIGSFLPEIEVEIYHGSSRRLPESTLPVVITSYGILRQDEALFSRKWQMVVMDEIQLAKNRRSQVWKACGRLPAYYKIGLSGTPVENSLKDLKAIFDIIFPGYLPEEPLFRNEFVHAIEKHRDPEALERLKKWIHPLVLRRKKSEVLKELPEKVDETSHCILSLEQQTLYENVMQSSRESILDALEDDNEPIPYMHIFSVLNALKQICNHPACYWRNRDVPALLKSHQSTKWDLFVLILQEALATGQKVVVFSQYLAQLDLIEEYLREEKIGYAGLRGQTRKRHEAVSTFQNDRNCCVFVASLLAAGLGIDLTSASVVILYDRWWNAARESQAVDRVHRMGQNRGVQVFRLVTVGTLEEKIDQMIQRKARLLEDVTPMDDPALLKRFTREDLIDIFSADSKKEKSSFAKKF